MFRFRTFASFVMFIVTFDIQVGRSNFALTSAGHIRRPTSARVRRSRLATRNRRSAAALDKGCIRSTCTSEDFLSACRKSKYFLGNHEALLCIHTVLSILTGQGASLTLDPQRFYNHLGRVIADLKPTSCAYSFCKDMITAII